MKKNVNYNDLIYRYMCLPEFLNLLFNRVIFFKRTTAFIDKNECIITALSETELCQKIVNTYPTTDMVKAREYVKGINHLIQGKMKNIYCIQSWSYSKDSFALWKLYSDNYGISIGSKIQNLRKQLNIINSENIPIFDSINYTNSLVEIINKKFDTADLIVTLPFIKIPSYSYEDEFRILLIDDNEFFKYSIIKRSEEGLCVPINPDLLIEEIIFSPLMPVWFFNLLKDIIKSKYPNLIPKIQISNL